MEIVEEEENEDIREWVVQKYIERPLLVDGRKFHLRAYVLAVGALKVYFFSDVLALFSLHQYPSVGADKDITNYGAHLTNTCYQHRNEGVYPGHHRYSPAFALAASSYFTHPPYSLLGFLVFLLVSAAYCRDITLTCQVTIPLTKTEPCDCGRS